MTENKIQLNIEDIKNLIPHRYPFLLIDKLKDIVPVESNRIKNVTFNENFFQGHLNLDQLCQVRLLLNLWLNLQEH